MILTFGRCKPLVALALLLAAIQTSFAGKEFLAGPREQIVPDQLLVGLQPAADINQVISALPIHVLPVVLSTQRSTYLLTLPPGTQATLSRQLAANPMVKFVEPNRIRTTTVAPPNDSLLTQQWNLAAIQALQAWDYFPGQYLTAATAAANRVKVAILDSGVDCTHPDFMNAGGTSTDSAHGGQLSWASSSAIQATTIPSPACLWEDDNGHGTHVAGIVAAATNNATGVASLGYPLQLIIIKTSDQNGNASDSQIAQGITAAISAGAQVISLSLGNAGYSQTLQAAIDSAWQSNILVVAAAGDTSDTTLIYPGAGNHVLGVGATDNTNTVASFSTYGEWVKIAAPGVNILSTLPGYGSSLGAHYGSLQGTSMAAPHVAALGGLLIAANPGVSVAAIAQRIQRTAQSPQTVWNQYIGYGVIDAAAAMGNIPGPFIQGSLSGQVVDANNNPITGATVTAGTQSYTTALDPITGSENGLFRVNLTPGTYPILVTASGHSTVNMQGVVIAGADTMLTIQMDVPSGEFTGSVTYNGVAVANAVVEAMSGGLIVGTAITNSAGGYALYLPPGSYTLTASAPNYINATTGAQVLNANGTVTVNLALSALGNLFGSVTDVNGIGVANALIYFTNGTFSGGAVTNSSGLYSTIGIPSGMYSVTASASGYSTVTLNTVFVTTNVSTPANLQFSTGISLNSGLFGFWPFNEGSGTFAYDQSGNLNHFTLTSPTWTTGLLYPYSLMFNAPATSGVGQRAITFTNGFSASVWVNSTTPENASSAIVETTSLPGWFLGVDQTGTMYKLVVNGGTGSTGTCGFQLGCAQGGTLASGWHMVTGTYDGVTAILYVDGVMVASDTFTNPGTGSPLQIGGNWGGAMQNLAAYNRALTASEVSALFTQGSSTNLSLSTSVGFPTVAAGASIGYTLTATNAGPLTALSATLSDVLPSGTGISWSISPPYNGPGTCSISNGALSCSFGNLPAGASPSVTITSATTSASCGEYFNTGYMGASNATTAQSSAVITVQCSQSINFGHLSDQVYGTRSYAISATATSDLPVTLTSLSGGVCSMSGTIVTLLSGGTCTIQATQTGNFVYSPATPVNQSFTVLPEIQTISFSPLPNQTFGTAVNLTATASSGLVVIFNSTTPSVCTVSGNSVTLVGLGSCTIVATQPGNASWSPAASITRSFTVTQGNQTITFGTLASQAYGTAPFNVNASASSGLTVSLSSQTTTVCTVSGNTVTLVSIGTCAIQASQPGNTNWSAAQSVTQSFPVTQGNQTIIFVPLANQSYGAASFPLSATASSGLPVNFTSQTTAVCSISNGMVTLVGVGTCTIQATQAGNANWAAAQPVSQSFGVSPGSQTITFGSLQSQAYGSPSVTVSGAASSGLPVSFNSLTGPVCTISGNTVTLVSVGTCTIQATQPGTTNWAAAPPVTQSFLVTPGSQTITFGAPQSQPFGTAPFAVSASASSGLPVSFSSQTTSVCTVSGSTVTLVAAGVCLIQATQAGSSNWAAAPAVSQGFAVTPGSQTITFGSLPSQAFGTAPFAVSGSASSGLPVAFTAQTTSVCTVSGSTVTLVAVGTCTIQATQAGNTNWAGAPAVNQSFAVTQGSQVITFGPLSNHVFGTGTFAVSGIASSGLPVSFSSQTASICTVSGSTVTLVAVGACTIQATQAGSANWTAAPSVNQSFQVTQGSQTITFGALQNQAFGSGPVTVAATASSGLPVSFNSQTTSSCTVSGSIVTLVGVGACTIQAAQAGSANWTAAPSINQSFQVTPGSQTITFGALQNQAFGSGPVTVGATASSGLPVSFNSLTTSICTVSGSTVTSVAVGVCTIQATQAGSTNWSAAPAVNQSFQVAQGSQTITFGALSNHAFGSGAFPVSASASSGLPVNFTSQTTSVCTTSGSTVTLVAVGACTLQATQAGSANWAAATPVNQTFQVTQGTQTITFGALQNQAFGSAPFAVSATASSGLPVSFTSQTTPICTMSGSTVAIVAAGTCTIQAIQAGNAGWAAAASVSQSFQVTAGSQTITFGPLSNQVYGTSPFPVGATASSGLTVSFTSQTGTICTVSGTTVTLVSGGTCTIQATQAGNANWTAAAPISQNFTVTQASQTITFGGLSNQPYGTAPFNVSATASSGLPVSFNSQTAAVCTVSGSSVTLTSVGTCTIQATQAGNPSYNPASAVNQSFTVSLGTQTVTFAALSNMPLGQAPFAVGATASSGLAVSFSSLTASVCTLSNSTVTLFAIGTCTIQAAQAGNADYSAAASVNQSFTVTAGIGSLGVNTMSFLNTVVGKSSAVQTFLMQNIGNAPLTISAIGVTGADAGDYRYTADAAHPCPIAPATLSAGSTCTLDLVFSPVAQGFHNNAQITATDNSGNVAGSTQSIGLAGIGIVLSSIAVSANSASLVYGGAEQFTATGTYSDDSTADVTNLVTWSSSATSVATITTGGLATATGAGHTNIAAALSGVTSSNFQLTVLPGSPTSIAIFSGSGQSATVGTAFVNQLQALVKDGGGDAVPNASVTFTAPSTGPSLTFANGLTTYTTTTNSSGIATSLALTANATTGNYSVTAATAGVASQATFSLSNLKAPALTITESAVGAFVQGRSGVYTVTVGNSANAGSTSGTVTMTVLLPAGLTLTGLNGGQTWSCNVLNSNCTTNTVLNPGAAYPSIMVTVSVGYSLLGSVSNEVTATGGASPLASYTGSATVLSACDLSLDGNTTIIDVQEMINEALGVTAPANDLNGDGMVNVVDIKIVLNAVLSLGCSAL